MQSLRRAAFLCLLICTASSVTSSAQTAASAPAAANHPIPSVGMEGRLDITLPGTLLDAKPVEDRSKIILRIADARPHGTLIHYDLRYMGMVPGTHDLRDYLVRKDGSPVTDLPPLTVRISGLLPPDHNGQLLDAPESVWRRLGGYKTGMTALVILWFLAFVALLVINRKRAVHTISIALVPRPTLADRLRPLVERAAQGSLDVEGQAELERLLLAFWRQRAGLLSSSAQDALATLKRHPQAGPLFVALENWLHKPPGSARVDVAALLQPYQNAASNEASPPNS